MPCANHPLHCNNILSADVTLSVTLRGNKWNPNIWFHSYPLIVGFLQCGEYSVVFACPGVEGFSMHRVEVTQRGTANIAQLQPGKAIQPGPKTGDGSRLVFSLADMAPCLYVCLSARMCRYVMLCVCVFVCPVDSPGLQINDSTRETDT